MDRWYAFLYENVGPVEALVARANELAESHKLPALPPLAAAPLVLKLRDEEVALEKETKQRVRLIAGGVVGCDVFVVVAVVFEPSVISS